MLSPCFKLNPYFPFSNSIAISLPLTLPKVLASVPLGKSNFAVNLNDALVLIVPPLGFTVFVTFKEP